MTAVDVDALDKLREAGSVGPWRIQPNFAGGWSLEIADGDGLTVRRPSGLTEADATLIVAAVNALPDLIAAVRRVEAVAEWLEAANWREGVTAGLATSVAVRRIRAALAALDPS